MLLGSLEGLVGDTSAHQSQQAFQLMPQNADANLAKETMQPMESAHPIMSATILVHMAVPALAAVIT